MEALNKVKDSYNINYLTQEIARVAILDQGTMKANVEAINQTKTILVNKLKELGFKSISIRNKFFMGEAIRN